MSLSRGPRPENPGVLRVGEQVLVLTNEFAEEVVVRVERLAARDDALTAAQVSSLALFRELFPRELLAPRQLLSVATMTFLTAELDQPEELYRELGDAEAAVLVQEFYRLLGQCVRREGGVLVKAVDECARAVFPEAVAAVRAGLDWYARLAETEGTRRLRPRLAVHRGPAVVGTLDERLDYFGATVRRTLALSRQARGGELILSQIVATDPQVDTLLRGRGLPTEILQPSLSGEAEDLLHRLTLPRTIPEGG